LGGVIAARATLERPRQVRRLVLVATSGGLDIGALGGAEWRQDYRRAYPEAQLWVTARPPDHIDRLEDITAPTVLLWGDHDAISPPAVGRELLKRLPRAVLKVIPGGTHAMVVERAPEIAALVRDHLDGDSTGP
jgi:poly(3-hydroxyoctanoate) depolymerase